MRSIDYFDKGAELDPDRAAIVEGDVQLSFREVQTLTYRVAAAMRKAGMKRQEPVAIYAPNHASVLICLLSLWRAGAVWIPVNARNAMDANVAYLNYVCAVWLFYHSSFAADAAQILARVPTIQHVICLDQADESWPSLDEFVASAKDDAFVEEVDAFGNLDEVVGIFPTGGTTGPAKGVSVNNLGWGIMLQTAQHIWSRGAKDPICLTTAPLTHAAGPMAIATMAFGATNVIMSGFHAGQVLRNIERHRITHLYCPPTALYALLDHPSVRKFDYSSLALLLLVGSPVSPAKLAEAVGIFGPCLGQCYGQVELPMLMTWLPPEIVAAAVKGDRRERLASCGKSTPGVRLAIVDDAGRILPNGERGEIVARGSLVSHSYFEMPEATAEAHRDGWHHTGDVGYRDADGFFYIVDRKKDMIITGGFNVFSSEVEACVMEIAGVREAAVIGVPDERWGEAIKAIVVASDGAEVTPEAVIAHCKTRLGGVKAPKSVEFWPDIPKTPNNKMDKKAIRARFWAHAEREVH